MPKRPFSPADVDLLWTRWREGRTLSDMAKELDRQPGTIHGFFARFGGIPPRPQTSSPKRLSDAERETISRGVAGGQSFRAIARSMNRAPSTVSREVSRNGGRGAYRAMEARNVAAVRRRRPKELRLAAPGRRRELVISLLRMDWSPQQIAGWIRRHHPNDAELHISHESIYRGLYVRNRTGIDIATTRRLRRRKTMRHSRNSTTRGQRRGCIVDAVPLSERPSEVESRTTIGHWEGDLVTGAANTHVGTLVERKSRYTVLVQLDGKDAPTVTRALANAIQRAPSGTFRTLTWDRDPELARHRELGRLTGVPIYFCDPRSPWQRGTNENTNRLLRQYMPRGTKFNAHTQADLDLIAARLNERPRKVLDYATPTEVLAEVLR